MQLKQLMFRLRHPLRQSFSCPVCLYQGPFRNHAAPTGVRKHARCPRCGSLERHRLQSLVFARAVQDMTVSKLSMLHVAPEPFFQRQFRSTFSRYETTDLERKDVDFRCDLQALPFPDASYDVVYASHVLEHVPDDRAAISEIRRVLKTGGIAILPVPIVRKETLEYGAPEPRESMHVRAPGRDYFERFADAFRRVDVHCSTDYPREHQLFIHMPPLSNTPRCPPTPDFVPVCIA